LLGALLLAGLAAAPSLTLADPGVEPMGELPAALSLQPDMESGRRAYSSCAVCHGPEGAGRADGSIPQLAGQRAGVIMKQLTDIRAGRRKNPVMLDFAKRLIDAQEIADVSAYLSALPPPDHNGVGPGSDLTLGERVYQRDCRRCHGARGEGAAEELIPSLAGQHYGYTLRQLRDIGAGRRGNAHPEMRAVAERYTDAQMMALADYASRLPPEGRVRDSAGAAQ